MARLNEDPRNEWLPKSQLWRTKRQYETVHAVKHGAIALEAHGWELLNGYPSKSHYIIAYKHVPKGASSGCNKASR